MTAVIKLKLQTGTMASRAQIVLWGSGSEAKGNVGLEKNVVIKRVPLSQNMVLEYVMAIKVWARSPTLCTRVCHIMHKLQP